MKRNIIFNAFYTIGIVVSIVGLKWAYTAQNYPVMGVLVATALLFLYLKINIVKEVRNGIKEKENQYNASIKDKTN